MSDSLLPTICHVVTDLNIGGERSFLLRLIKKTKALGLENKVLVLGRKGSLSGRFESLCEVHYCQMPSPLALVSTAKAIRALGHFDIIHAWQTGAHSFTAILKLMNLKSKKIVWSLRYSLDAQPEMGTSLINRSNAIFSHFADAVIYNSRSSKERHIKIGYNSKNARVIPHGFTLPEKVPTKTTVTECRRSLGLPIDNRIFLFPARWTKRKGHQVLFEALRKGYPELSGKPQFLFVGRDTDLEKAAKIVPNSTLENMHFLGELKDLTVAYTACDIVLLPALAETFSDSVGEGMAFGRMAMVTDTGDLPFLVGEEGFVCKVGDPIDLLKKLKIACELPEEEIKRRGLASRKRILKNFLLDKVLQRYFETYSSI